MDPVINSLVQSPLVRSMSTVPSKASSFVHGVRDNVPPFSFQKVVVQPWNNPSLQSQNQSHKFRIPQFGTLNRAYLRIKTVNQVPTEIDTVIAEADYASIHEPVVANAAAPVNANYTALSNKFRIPWIHKSQISGSAFTNLKPFGAGGCSYYSQAGMLEPETSVPNTAKVQSLSWGAVSSDPESLDGQSSNGWNVVNILDEMRLTTNGKLIETVYGETIPAEVIKMPQQLRDFYIMGMTGWACGDNSGAPLSEPNYEGAWDPSACRRDGYGRYQTAEQSNGTGVMQISMANQHANFIVPVPLSSLKSLPKNYQTRFVEDLELEVKTKALARGFNEFTAGVDLTSHHEVELVLIYHNWHDNIENTIRNSNYKRGVPASVYSTNWVRAATTAKVTSATLPISIPLTSRNLITELVVVARSLNAGDPFTTLPVLSSRKSDYTVFLGKQFTYNIEFTGSGKSIWSGTNKELHGPDSSDYDLVERKMVGGDAGYGGVAAARKGQHSQYGLKGGIDYDGAGKGRVHGGGFTHGGIDHSFGDNMAVMRFGFQTTDEFYSGGVALQTISNPTIVITPPKTQFNQSWTEIGLEFDVYVKHANLVRIDSDTGAVTRTLDV